MRYIILLVKLIFLSLLLSVVFSALYLFMMRGSVPSQYEAGKRADDLARAIQMSVQRQAWAETGAIRWSFLDYSYLWDLQRGLVRARYDKHEVLFDVAFKRYAAKRKSTEGKKGRWITLSGEDARIAAREGYENWLRDRFILEPSQSLFDDGVERYFVSEDDSDQRLLVHYRRGGPHPNDTYLWSKDEYGLPSGIRLWSDQLPLPWLTSGQQLKMSRWRILDTGLKVSTLRSFGPFSFEIKVKAALTLTHLLGRVDPLKAIEGDPFDPPPSSQPNNLPKPKSGY